jgi:chromosome partitioning protein
MRVLTFFNHAGGAGKTTLTLNVGHALAGLGHRVLLIDADPQGNLTSWVGLSDVPELDETLYPAVMGRTLALPPPKEAHGMHVIPAQLDLAELEQVLPGQFMGQLRLREAVHALRGRYDFVLIDSPPSLGQLAALSVLAADHLVVPVIANHKGLQGLASVTRMVETFRRAVPTLNIGLLVPTQVQATTLSANVVTRLQGLGLAPVSVSTRHRPSAVPNSQLQGEPLEVYDPRDPAAEEIRAITRDLLNAIGEVPQHA